MKKLVYILFAFCIASMYSCENDGNLTSDANDHFYLRNNNAEMPVFVKGNTASKTFIIWISGGPGSSTFAHKYGDYKIMELMEEKYGNVYWDQRCAGSSTGTFDPDDLTLDQYVEDLEKLVYLIKDLYGNDIQIILEGHSFGGTLGLAYLSKGNNQDQVDGFICNGGPYNFPQLKQDSKNMMIELANRQISYNNKVSDWENIIDELYEIDEFADDTWLELNEVSHKTNPLLTDVDSVNSFSFNWLDSKLVFGAPSVEFAIKNKTLSMNENFIEELENTDLSLDIANITIPVIFVSGKYDVVVPPNHLHDAMNIISSPVKEHLILERSHHFTCFTEPHVYEQHVSEFIENL